MSTELPPPHLNVVLKLASSRLASMLAGGINQTAHVLTVRMTHRVQKLPPYTKIQIIARRRPRRSPFYLARLQAIVRELIPEISPVPKHQAPLLMVSQSISCDTRQPLRAMRESDSEAPPRTPRLFALEESVMWTIFLMLSHGP